MAGKLGFTMMASLDGYINDAQGGFDWDQIDPAVHAHANAEAERVGTEIYGRRMYEVMAYWETVEADDPVEADFARLWRAQDKIVVSRTLGAVASARTTLVPALGADEVRRLKAAATKDLAVSGPTLAATYLAAGLVDEIGVYVVPVVVGSGTPMFQGVDATRGLERVEVVPFANGVTFMRFRPRA